MNASNRFAIETLARQRETAIERGLQRNGHLRDALALSPETRRKTGIIVGTTVLSLALAFGLSYAMAFALAFFA